MFPHTFTRNSNEVAAVATSRKRIMAERICEVREQYTKTQHNLQQLMNKVDGYLHVTMNPLTQQTEYYTCLQNLDYIKLCLEDLNMWCTNLEASSFVETPVYDNPVQMLLSCPPPGNTSPNATSMSHPESVANIPMTPSVCTSNSQSSNFALNSQGSAFAPNSQGSTLAPNSHSSTFALNSQGSTLTSNSQGSTLTLNSQGGTYAPNPQASTFVLNSQVNAVAPVPAPSTTLIPTKASPVQPITAKPKSNHARKSHSKKNSELLIDFSSTSSLASTQDYSVASVTTESKPSVQSVYEPPAQSIIDQNIQEHVPKPIPALTKKKIDQLEAAMVTFKVEEDDPTVCSLPAQEILETDVLHNCVIVHAINPSQFYIMVYLGEMQRGFPLSRVTDAMEEYYSQYQVCVRELLSDMTYCAVRQQSEWFRCLITKTESPDELEVYFVDYGGVEVVPIDVVQPLVPRFCEKPPFARLCHLFGIEPSGGGEWTEKAIELLTVHHCTSLVKIKVDDDGSESLGVTLYLPNGETLNSQLIEMGLAVPNTLPPPVPNHFSAAELSQQVSPTANEAYKNASRSSLRNVNNQYGDVFSGSPASTYDPWDITDCPEYVDPLMAVQGYVNRDEAEICKHFKGPPGTTCFKGKNCTKKHIMINPDGWTRDKVEVHAVPLELPLPAEGERICVCVSHVESYNIFFIQMPDSDACWCRKICSCKSYFCKEEITVAVPTALTRLVTRMNAPSVQHSLKPLAGIPALGEMVTAWYPDKKLYRAQVFELDSDNNRVKLLYVDFGNRAWVTMDQIFYLSPEFLDTPFLAIRCILADISLKKEERLADAIKVVRGSLVEKAFHAKVISYKDSNTLLLELEDSAGFSIAQTLVTSHANFFSYQPVSRKKSPLPKGPIVVPH